MAKTEIMSADENGYTLVEMMLTCALIAVLLAMTTPIVSMFFDLNGDVQNTYTAVNQVVLASEEITQYVHEAIAPCPTGSTVSGCITVPFANTTQSSLTFYANVNSTLGPTKVVASVSGTTLTVLTYAATSNCPFNGSSTTWCSFSSNPHLLDTVTGLANTSPFTYIQTNATTGASSNCNGTNAGSSNNPCTSPISAVNLNIQLLTKGKGMSSGYQSFAYPLASTYSGIVG